MESSLDISRQQSAKCAAWYHQTGSFTKMQRNDCTENAKSVLFQNYILELVQALTNIIGFEMQKHRKDVPRDLIKMESVS